MSQALYRRYRPESFADVIGQSHVTEPLQQALTNKRIHHAYLFSGPRGCGKTTSARILARCLNCEQGPTPTPCGTCQSCQDLAREGSGSLDVIEIDAASHGGVEDARDLRERAFYAPASSRFKIYIIDEAHMVSREGFNALLKLVEEPPDHVKFVFATTEPDKVIPTIRSRTHHYPFRLVPPGELQAHLARLCELEGVTVGKGVLPLVVRAGRGSVRDSMSVLDQLVAGAGKDGVTYPLATALLGYTDATLLDDTIEAFAAGDGAAVFSIVDRVVEAGHDPKRFADDLLERLRDLVIIDAVPDTAATILSEHPADELERMRQQAAHFGAAQLSRAADIVNTGLTEMRGATAPRLHLELICARVLLPAADDEERGLGARLDRLERRMAISGTTSEAPVQAAPPAAERRPEPVAEPTPPPASTEPPAALPGQSTEPMAAELEPAAPRRGRAAAVPARPGPGPAAARRRARPDGDPADVARRHGRGVRHEEDDLVAAQERQRHRPRRGPAHPRVLHVRAARCLRRPQRPPGLRPRGTDPGARGRLEGRGDRRPVGDPERPRGARPRRAGPAARGRRPAEPAERPGPGRRRRPLRRRPRRRRCRPDVPRPAGTRARREGHRRVRHQLSP